MRSHPFLILFIFTLLLLLTDGYTYRGIRKIVHDYSKRTEKGVTPLFIKY